MQHPEAVIEVPAAFRGEVRQLVLRAHEVVAGAELLAQRLAVLGAGPHPGHVLRRVLIVDHRGANAGYVRNLSLPLGETEELRRLVDEACDAWQTVGDEPA